MSTTVAAPAGRGMVASRVLVGSAVDFRPSQHWGERVLALTLTIVAMVLNATLVGAIVGVPLFLLAISLMMESIES